MTDAKNVLTELEMIKKFHESIIDESTNVKEINTFKGCLVAINHAITAIEEMEERIAIMSEGIVRCKDCKHGCYCDLTKVLPTGYRNLARCTKTGFAHDADWFCADGERKES